jgi:hypothetical protein
MAPRILTLRAPRWRVFEGTDGARRVSASIPALIDEGVACPGSQGRGSVPADPEEGEALVQRLEQEIKARTEEFVGELATLIKKAALEAVGEALKIEHTPAPLQKASSPMPVFRSRKKATAVPQARGGKRSSETLAFLSRTVLFDVRREPGRGIEEIAASVGLSTKELTLPVKMLLADGHLRRQGEERATKYYSGHEMTAPRSGRKIK